MNDPSRSPSGFKLVTSAERLKVLSLAAPRFFAWVVDTAIFAALVFVLYHVDGVYLQGDLALNMVYEADRRLIEETQNSLDGDVEQTISIYEEDRLYENGTTVTWRVRVDHRVGQEPSGEPWELKLETKEFVEADGELPGKYGFAVLATFIMAPLPYRYFLESSPWQGTLGMRLFGLKVTTWDLKRPGQGKILERNLWRFLSVLILFIGYFMALFTTHKQTLHDKLTGTLVVKAKRLEELERG